LAFELKEKGNFDKTLVEASTDIGANRLKIAIFKETFAVPSEYTSSCEKKT